MSELIEKAKNKVAQNKGFPVDNWPWVVARSSDDAHPNGEYDIEIHVWASSPAKGYIVANYGRKYVTAHSSEGKRLYTYKELA